MNKPKTPVPKLTEKALQVPASHGNPSETHEYLSRRSTRSTAAVVVDVVMVGVSVDKILMMTVNDVVVVQNLESIANLFEILFGLFYQKIKKLRFLTVFLRFFSKEISNLRLCSIPKTYRDSVMFYWLRTFSQHWGYQFSA